MELSVYPEYKNSGVDWLGEVPEHWEVLPLRNIASFQNGHGFPHDLQGQEEGDFPFVKVSDISFLGKELKQSENYVNAVNIKNNKWQIVPRKSVILPKIGEALKLNHRKVLSLDGLIDNNILAIKPSNKIQYSWLYYLLLSIDMGWVSNPSTVPTIDMEQLKSLSMPLPYYQEQTQIAKFLDHKTAQIDRLIEKKKALIEKLNEKRTALITQAVTKGLNPDASMKDSGVDWLGEVPEHWEVRKLKFLCEFSTGWTPPTKQPEYFDGDNIWVTIADMDKKLIHDSKTKISDEAVSDFGFIQVPKGALLYSFKLSVGKVGFAGTNLYTNEAILFVLPNANYDINFLYYLFSVSIIKNASENIYGAKILNQELIKNSFLVYLSHKEQSQIAEFLDDKTTKIDKLANKASEAIDTLNEYRTALITAAVTGKIDVRNVELPKSS